MDHSDMLLENGWLVYWDELGAVEVKHRSSMKAPSFFYLSDWFVRSPRDSEAPRSHGRRARFKFMHFR